MSVLAEIITIGDEILYGQTLDTNSHWISQELSTIGISLYRKTTIGDQKETILNTISSAEKNVDVIFITGGLGPTSDDLTKPCLLEYFDTHLVRNQQVLEHIQHLFAKVGRDMSSQNEQQADLPANCEVIFNKLGTAPGMWFERDNRIIISMPGVPYEMKGMMKDSILPKLKKRFIDEEIYHKIIRTVGVPESRLSSMIQGWEQNLPKDMKLAYLPTLGTVKLRLTTKGTDLQKLKKSIDEKVQEVLPIIENHVYGFDEEELEEAIGRMLSNNKLTIACAESCTGGYLSHKITSVPGSSHWFNGAMIPYSNRLKEDQLGISKQSLIDHGAVSEHVVLEMANNIRARYNADIGISISGIAGPGGGTVDKPVGTVWIGYSDKKKTIAKKYQFTKDRLLNIQFTTTMALNMIRLNLEPQ